MKITYIKAERKLQISMPGLKLCMYSKFCSKFAGIDKIQNLVPKQYVYLDSPLCSSFIHSNNSFATDLISSKMKGFWHKNVLSVSQHYMPTSQFMAYLQSIFIDYFHFSLSSYILNFFLSTVQKLSNNIKIIILELCTFYAFGSLFISFG